MFPTAKVSLMANVNKHKSFSMTGTAREPQFFVHDVTTKFFFHLMDFVSSDECGTDSRVQGLEHMDAT